MAGGVSPKTTRTWGPAAVACLGPWGCSQEDHQQKFVRIDNSRGLSFIPRSAQITSSPSSRHLRFPMFWAHLKIPHRGLPRAFARREASYPSRTLQTV
jgi:hypothetical protein